jgi:hypothetical protein
LPIAPSKKLQLVRFYLQKQLEMEQPQVDSKQVEAIEMVSAEEARKFTA